MLLITISDLLSSIYGVCNVMALISIYLPHCPNLDSTRFYSTLIGHYCLLACQNLCRYPLTASSISRIRTSRIVIYPLIGSLLMECTPLTGRMGSPFSSLTVLIITGLSHKIYSLITIN